MVCIVASQQWRSPVWISFRSSALPCEWVFLWVLQFLTIVQKYAYLGQLETKMSLGIIHIAFLCVLQWICPVQGMVPAFSRETANIVFFFFLFLAFHVFYAVVWRTCGLTMLSACAQTLSVLSVLSDKKKEKMAQVQAEVSPHKHISWHRILQPGGV